MKITTSKNEKAHRLLALALCCAILEPHVTVWIADSVAFRTPPTRLLALPLFYFYIRTLTQGTQLTLRDGWHFIPFAISAVYHLLVRTYRPQALLEGSLLFLWELIVVTYGYFALTYIQRYREQALRFVSDYSEVRINWLLVGSAMLAIIWSLETVFAFSIPYATTLLLVAIAFFSLRKPLAVIETARPNTEGESAALTPAQLKKYSQEMTELFLKSQLHLKPELRLPDLATALNLKSYRVSEIIQRGLHTNFYDLVNGYRVTKAKHMLGDSQFDHCTLLSTAKECGFRSKWAFNAVFKTKTGLTPSDFRKSSRQDSPDEQLD